MLGSAMDAGAGAVVTSSRRCVEVLAGPDHGAAGDRFVASGLARRRWLFGMFAVALLPGCSAPSAPAVVGNLFGGPPELDATVEASARVNPDSRGRPSPLLLRIYELKASASFGNADFVSLYQRDQAELGADLLAREELLLLPGERRPFKRVLNAQTRFLGVFAAYRDLERAHWRVLLPIEARRKIPLTIRADELALTLVPR